MYISSPVSHKTIRIKEILNDSIALFVLKTLQVE
jgi:hypothetical protein